jgi:hypothetical protein
MHRLPPDPALQANIKAPEVGVITHASAGIHPTMVGINDLSAEVVIAKTVVNADRHHPFLLVKFLCRCQSRTSYQYCGGNEQYSKPIHNDFLSGQARLSSLCAFRILGSISSSLIKTRGTDGRSEEAGYE